ncbi:prepilin peptidase [Caproicibacter fermentans]|uniref:prepilin peptidase n=1 Tax=Caproicibacter fermentans TaxID=2576756 RepID=UPI0014136394
MTFPLSCFLSSLAYIVLTFHSNNIDFVTKGLILTQCLVPASIIDFKTREIPDWIHVLLILVGLIRLNLPYSLIGALVIFVPCLIFTMISKGEIGGGDIKLLTACGFVLGLTGIVLGSIVGLTLFCTIHLLLHDHKKRHAMAPCISVGCFFAYLLIY